MFLIVINVFVSIILVIFLLLTIRIFFVFIIGIKKNAVLNKSVSKNVFQGKFSLFVIVLFFTISFGLVGGMQLMNTNGSKSIEKQFNENNLFQGQLRNSGNKIFKSDPLLNYGVEYYASTSGEVYGYVPGQQIVNQTLINMTLSDTTIEHFNNEEYEEYEEYDYNKINFYNDSDDGTYKKVPPSIVFSDSDDNIFCDQILYNNDTLGWDTNEWETAIKYQLETTTENWTINKNLGGGTSYADIIVNSLFSGSYEKFGYSLFEYSILTNQDWISEKNSNRTNDEFELIKDEINKFLDQFTYSFTTYINTTPIDVSSDNDFEMILINDINFKDGTGISSDEDDLLTKKSADNRNVNNISYKSGLNSNEEFREKSILNTGTDKAALNNQVYSIIVQEDYLLANNLKVGDTIEFNSNVSFYIESSVKFNAITYPIMGLNILPDKSKQAVIGINLSDFLMFASSTEYFSLMQNTVSIFFGIDDSYNELKSLNSWYIVNGKAWNILKDEIFEFKTNFNLLVSPYNINKEIAIDQFNTWSEELEKGWSSTSIENYVNNFSIGDNFLGGGNFKYGAGNFSNEQDTYESLMAFGGPAQILVIQKILNILAVIFMVIVLIVLSMLINKRIKMAGKQIGTLKAMGMKNKDIASSYTLYPIIIILLGFIFASIVSPLVMLAFISIFSQYFYITFTSFALSFSYIKFLLIIPLIMSIGMIYIMAQLTLRKSTLDLLTNKTNDSPNILVRAIGYFTPMSTPFSVSYITKGLFKATGKSSLLFISIFLATFLTGFAMSSTTMIKHQTESIFEYLNFDSLQIGMTNNGGQYEFKKLYIDDDPEKNGLISYQHQDDKYKISLPTESEDSLILFLKNSQLLEINDISFKINHNIFEEFYTKINSLIFEPLTSIDKEELIINYTDPKGDYWIPKDYMIEILLTNIIVENIYNLFEVQIDDQSETFSEWEKLNDIGNDTLTFTEFNEVIKSWLLNSMTNMTSYNIITKDTDNFFNIILENIDDFYEATTDVVFGSYYYDQTEQIIYDYIDINPYNYAWNSSNQKEINMELDEKQTTLSILTDEQAIQNSYGVSHGKEIWDENFGILYDENGDINKNVNYIPVVATTQSKIILDSWVDNGIATKNNKGIYTISMSPSALISSNDSKELSNVPILVNIKVMDSVYLGIDFGITTTKDFFINYMESYEDNIEKYSGDLYRKFTEGEEYYTYDPEEEGISDVNIYGSNYADTFTSNYENSSTILEEVFPFPDNIPETQNVPTSFVPTINSYNNSILEGKPDGINMEQLLINPEKYFSINNGINYTNGYPIKIDELLVQAQEIYTIVISVFSIVSIFIIFISTTIILIAMKDIIDSAKREVSMLKAFGYSNTKATTLLLIPYLIIMFVAMIVAIPLTLIGLSALAAVFTALTGSVYMFTLTFLQVVVLIGYVTGISLLLFFLGYISFYRTNALEAIKATDE